MALTVLDPDLVAELSRDPCAVTGSDRPDDILRFLAGGQAYREASISEPRDELEAPDLQTWVFQRVLGKDVVGYWGWTSLARLLSPDHSSSVTLCMDWVRSYQEAYPVYPGEVAFKVEDRLVRELGFARCHPPEHLFGQKDPFAVQSYLRGYEAACRNGGGQPAPALQAIWKYGEDLKEEISLREGTAHTWAHVVAFTRAGFDGSWKNWFEKMISSVEKSSGISIPPVEAL